MLFFGTVREALFKSLTGPRLLLDLIPCWLDAFQCIQTGYKNKGTKKVVCGAKNLHGLNLMVQTQPPFHFEKIALVKRVGRGKKLTNTRRIHANNRHGEPSHLTQNESTSCAKMGIGDAPWRATRTLTEIGYSLIHRHKSTIEASIIKTRS